ncbi:MAG: M3 family oligoendopeptidase [Deltaproteobacteria bacterium]|nr:M3 family oligoendopeptidase [Deltaproteobacteria bacterium]
MTTNDNLPHWNLSLLYEADSPELARDTGETLALTERFLRWRDKARRGDVTKEEFRLMLDEYVRIREREIRLSSYAGLAFAQDTQDQKILSFQGKLEEILAEVGNKTLFFVFFWQSLEDDESERLSEGLPAHRHWLKRLRTNKPHTLSEPEERIISLKDITGRDAVTTLYDTITGRYKFRSHFDPSRKGKELSREELSVYFRSPDPKTREEAYKEFYRVYGGDGPLIAQIFQAISRDWRIENVNLRGYPHPQAARNNRNDLPGEVVESLLSVSKSEAPRIFGAYFKKKRELLKLETFRRYDLYAPYSGADEEEVPFDAALNLVKEAFSELSPDLAKLAMSVNESEHLSARLLPNKRSGAFCCSVLPEDCPWVLMSYKGRRQDVFTLAHELGHASHSLLAKDKGVMEFEATLPLAETASTFGEMLLAKKYLDGSAGVDGGRDVLFHVLDDAYATVGRQAFFALFEIEAHDMVFRGATADELSRAYLKNLETQFGDSMTVGGEFAWEWTCIPHFFQSPFYVYAYTFGQLLVYSLWNVFEKEGKAFAPKLIRILSLGSSASPADILASAGVGPLNDEFWAGGYGVIERFLNALS